MAGTRSSARLSQSQSGNKRKAEDSPPPAAPLKRGRKASKQQTLEQTLDNGTEDENGGTRSEDVVMDDAKDTAQNGHSNPNDLHKGSNGDAPAEDDPDKALKASRGGPGLNTIEETDSKPNGGSKPDTDSKTVSNDEIHDDHEAPQTKNGKLEESVKADESAKADEPAKTDEPAKADEPTTTDKPTTTDGAAKVDEAAKPDESDESAKVNESAKPGESAKAEENANGGAIEEDAGREQAMPSNILEKGIVYFFTRGRVGVEDVESVQDLQRSHFVLRPIPDGAKIGDGAIDDLKNARLMALPKKVWPKTPADKFMAFVEKAGASVKELKDEFFAGSEYETATLGTRVTPPVTPIGEGVYAITATGTRGESHLAYMLTIPQEPGELQQDVGLKDKGSFVLSLKNPESKGPANASLPQKPDWPPEFIEEFRKRSWMPAAPKHLDYANAQILMIGESFDESHALEPADKDKAGADKETPLEELEKLEGEDLERIEHLKGDDSIFADLKIKKEEYGELKTTW